MRERTELGGGLATLLQRVVLDGEQFELPTLPPVVGGTWGDLSLEGTWGPLHVEGPELIWQPNPQFGATTTLATRLATYNGLSDMRNQPAVLRLADGTELHAEFGHTVSNGPRGALGPGHTCAFEVWHTVRPRMPVRWVGQLRGARAHQFNLSVVGHAKNSWTNLRLAGNYTWHLLDVGADKPSVTVVLDRVSGYDHEALRTDFSALQVALGRPLDLDTLVGFDEPGNVIAAAGPHLGGHRAAEPGTSSTPPVPEHMGSKNECWSPYFFQKLVGAMNRDPSLRWSVVCSAFMDSICDTTIDSQYMKLQLGLEAFASVLLRVSGKKSPLLVEDSAAWELWVKSVEESVRSLAASGKAKQLLGKLRSVMHSGTSNNVADALRLLEPAIHVDPELLEELLGRNITAHNFTMNRPGTDYDVDRDFDRVNMLRALLAALIARACGYDGALAGWTTSDASKWKPQPGWWPAPSDEVSAKVAVGYVCQREPRSMPSRQAPSSSGIW